MLFTKILKEPNSLTILLFLVLRKLFLYFTLIVSICPTCRPQEPVTPGAPPAWPPEQGHIICESALLVFNITQLLTSVTNSQMTRS